MPTIAVIGAGIVGASAAYRLSCGDAQVTVIDNGADGGATAAGAGIVATIGSTPMDQATAAFRFAAARYYGELADICRQAGMVGHHYAAVGQLTVAQDDAEFDALRAEMTRVMDLVNQFGTAAVGAPEWLTAADVKNRFPLLDMTAGALWMPGIARVDGDAMRGALLRLAVMKGATHVTETSRPEIRDGRVVGVRTRHGVIEADAVVVAAGAWSGGLVDSLGPAVAPQRGQIVHLHLPGSSALPTIDSPRGHYLLTFPGDRVVIGATRETGSGFAATLTASGIAQVLAQGLSLVPALASATWVTAKVGLRPVSVDGHPYLGPAPGVNGLWIATGMGASGLTLGPYCGAVIADHVLASITGGEPPPSR